MPTLSRISPAKYVEQGDGLQYGVMAAFMGSARGLDHASSLFFVAALLLSVPGKVHGWMAATCIAVNLCLAMVAKYYGWRVALDEKLFLLLAQHAGHEAAFDDALAICLGQQPNGSTCGSTRSAASRWKGAKCLLKFQAATIVLQGLATAFTGMAFLL